MSVWKRNVYYYDTADGFAAERFAGRFLQMVEDEKKRQNKKEILFLCIGTDRSTGDSLGPLIGYKLTESGIKNAVIMGTLDHPVHAVNLEHCIEQIQKKYFNSIIVAVDASVGNLDQIGYVTLGRGALKPGLGVKKELSAVGDIFITGIVGCVGDGDPVMLQSIRLSVVMRLADCISHSLLLGMKLMEYSVENFSRKAVSF